MGRLRANGQYILDLERREFVSLFGSVYEHSAWVAERVYDAGLSAACAGLDMLAIRMRSVVDQAGAAAQLSLLRAHPHLADGLRLPDLTRASSEEQQGAGLDNCRPEELQKFKTLNQRYIEKFGFPFIVAVAGKGRVEILKIFENRLTNSLEDEFTTGLAEVHKIARFRLEKLILSDG